MEGWLLKRGAQDHRRWCSLKGWSLTWSTNTGGEVLGVLDLRGSRFMTNPAIGLTFKIEGGVPLNSSKVGKDYILTADHEADFKKWKDAIDKAAELNKDEAATHKGYLMKEGGKHIPLIGKGIPGVGGRGSEKRFFELKGHIVTYSECEGGKVLGSLDLRGARVKCSADSLAFTLEGPILNVQKKGKSYELAALTFEEMRSWTEQLKRACESQEI
eukprot:TRINITY_DN6156_c0_g3_i3.p1 TRINITY_DN6156_c0_g3~~TRINITY_DN6156_c0_g3_i3.p1  ORF type:complete len:215 (+),score=31.55 TRINITY_DN6156_c0_g3_i3:208-852(+)